MWVKNIFGKKINVLYTSMEDEQILEFDDDFKKTQEFKNLKAQKYISEVENPNDRKDDSTEECDNVQTTEEN